MQTKKAVLFLVIIFSAIIKMEAQVNVANIGATLTIQQCVDIAIKNNLQVAQNQFTMESNGVYRNQAIANLLPTLNASGSQGIYFGKSVNPTTYAYVNQQQGTGSYALNAGITLFSGLQLQNAIKQNQFAYDASKMDLQQQKDNITLLVLLAYLQVLSAQELLDISHKQADVDAKQVQRLEDMNKEGAVTPLSNLSDLRGQYAADQASIIISVNNLESAKIGLFQLLNVPYKRDVQYQQIPLDLLAQGNQSNPDSIFQTALNIYPQIKSADLKVRSYQKGLQYYRGQYYPTLSFYGTIASNYSSVATNTFYGPNVPTASNDFVTVGGTNYSVFVQQPSSTTTSKISFSDQFKNNKYTQIGLQLSVPILNGFRARNNVKLAKINLENAEANANSARNVLQTNIEQAYQNQISAYGQLKSYQDQSNAFGESFRITEIRFNEGAVTSVDYVLAKNKVDQANVNLIATKYSYIFRTKILDYYQGNLKW